MTATDPFITSPTLSASSSFSGFSSPSSLHDSDDSESHFVTLSPPPSVHSVADSFGSGKSMRGLNGSFDRLNINRNHVFGRGNASNASSSGSSSPISSLSSFSSFACFETASTGSFADIDLDSEIDPSTQLLVAQLMLTDLVAYRATLKNKRPITRTPDDTELALQQQEDELRALITSIRDAVLARSIDKAVESDAEVIRALETMERSEREDRRAAEMLSQEDRLPQPTETQSVVGGKGFVIPERNDDDDASDDDDDDSRTVIVDAFSTPSFFSRRFSDKPPHAKPSAPPKVECISCADKFAKNKCLTAVCMHIYCHACVISLVEACMRDETLYPVKCCQQPFSRNQLASILSVKLRLEFEDKCREFGTPAQARVYCSNPHCSAFLGSSSPGATDGIYCGSCRTSTCTGCKRPSHPFESCRENVDVIKLREIATSEGWQTCPGCKAIIELEMGCYHMTCRCRTEFCYLCAARWKTCQCPQWDENRLVVDARRRVVNEMGAGARYAEPRVYEHQVRQRVEQLRTTHECVVHDWAYRHGGGACEHCGDYLPNYLKICRGCAMLACRRCALNRL